MISEQQAVERARSIARERGWTWREPVRVTRSRRFVLFGRERWSVRSNANMRGAIVFVVIDAHDGALLHAGYVPR
jgi:hypothetical protein